MVAAAEQARRGHRRDRPAFSVFANRAASDPAADGHRPGAGATAHGFSTGQIRRSGHPRDSRNQRTLCRAHCREPSASVEAHLCRAGWWGTRLRARAMRVRQHLPLLVVFAVWVTMLVGTLAFVDRYGSNVPSWDGWDMVPTLTGHQPVTVDWLWSQHNEHRVPVPRLLLLGLHRMTGINFRTPMFFNVLVTGALALGMILVARRLRGSASYTDAFFPLIFLHWG